MTIDEKIRDEKLQYDINREAGKISVLSSGKFDKYQYFTGEEILPPDQSRVIEQANFTYSLLGKVLEEQMKKQVDPLKSLKLANKIDELKQIESIFPKNQLNGLIIDKLKEIIHLQNNIKLHDLEYTAKRGKRYCFTKYSLPIVFLKDIREGNLLLEDPDKEQIILSDELKDMGKGKIPIE